MSRDFDLDVVTMQAKKHDRCNSNHVQQDVYRSVVCALLLILATAAEGGIAGPAAPANDACANATIITARIFEDTLDTTDATTDAAEPIPECGNGSRGKSVWYQFTVPESGPLTVDTFDSEYDTILSAFTGACDALAAVPDGCSDDDPDDGAQSKVSLQATVGTTYSFRVSAFADDGGSLMFRLRLFRVPSTATPTPSVTPTATETPTQAAEPVGDANCDGHVSAADLTRLVMLITSGDRAPCRRDDSNGDGILDATDTDAAVAELFS